MRVLLLCDGILLSDRQEITNAEREASKAEDRVIEQMMAIEEVERRVKRLDAELKEADEAVAVEKQRLETRFAEEKKDWMARSAEREEISKRLPEAVKELYTRLAKKHPGSVMAEARGEQCCACGMRVLPHTLQLLKSEADEEVFRCEGCGRILYSLEPVPRVQKESSDGAPQP